MAEKIEHEGFISSIKDGVICVNIIQTSACSECHAKSLCNLSEKKEKVIEIPYFKKNFNVGEKVTVSGSASIGLIAVLFSFVIPLILLVVVLSLFIAVIGDEALSAIFAIVSLFIYYLLLYLFRGQFSKKLVFSLEKK